MPNPTGKAGSDFALRQPSGVDRPSLGSPVLVLTMLVVLLTSGTVVTVEMMLLLQQVVDDVATTRFQKVGR